MFLVLHPRAAPGPVVQVWIGVFGVTAAPPLRWQLNGADAEPVAVSPLAGARTDHTMVAVTEPRAFTGVYEFRPGISPGTTYDVRAAAGMTWSDVLRVRTLPAGVPADGAFNVLLASCFYRNEDRAGRAGALAMDVRRVQPPDLTLLMGDQVYLDLPTMRNFDGGLKGLAATFEENYTENWSRAGGYAEILRSAPSASIPDDHEYWNNAPHNSPIVWQSLFGKSRDNWHAAAAKMYDAFQLSKPGGYRPMLELDVPPLSFFLMDNRTFRARDRRSSLPRGGLEQFRAWADRIGRAGHYGVVVTGQSLFKGRAGRLARTVFDGGPADYDDYRPIMDTIIELARRGRPVLCLTGDVHYGRVVEAREVGRPATRVYEVIASPASLVTMLGKDQLATLRRKDGDPWYRHGDADDPPGEIGGEEKLTGRLSTRVRYPTAGQKGNHVALLAFRRAGFGLELRVTYWMAAAPDGTPGIRHEVAPIPLTPTF